MKKIHPGTAYYPKDINFVKQFVGSLFLRLFFVGIYRICNFLPGSPLSPLSPFRPELKYNAKYRESKYVALFIVLDSKDQNVERSKRKIDEMV